MDKIDIIKELKELLIENFGDTIDKIILFGSQINGKAKEYSDYDILIILNDDYDWELKNKIICVCNEIDIKYDIYTDITIMSQSELNSIRGKQPFILAAFEQGVYI